MNLSFLKKAFSVRLLASAAVLLAAHQLLALAAPYLVKIAIDDGIHAGNTDILWVIGIAGLLIYAASAATRFGGRWLSVKAGERAWQLLRNRVFEHIQGLSLLQLRQRRVGGMASRINSDTFRLKQLAASVLPSLISLVVGVGGTAVILLILAPRLTLLALIPLPIGYFVLRWFRKYVRPMSREKMERHASLHSAIHEALAGAEDVKALGAEEEMIRRVEADGEALKDAELTLAWHRSKLGPAADFGVSLILLGTLVVGGHMAITGALSVGTIVVFYFYIGRCLGPVRRIPGLVYSWHAARAAMDRMEQVLSIEDEIAEPEDPVDAQPGALSVTFDAVDFAYEDGGDSVALDGFDLDVESGARAAILGPSGVGKTTTARLMLRLMDGASGQLNLQDQPIRKWSFGALRRRIGYVGQEVFLFDGSLLDNIALGCDLDFGTEEIERAVDDAGLRDVVDSGRGGLDMQIGEKGDRLSGGQKKRVALARALLRDPDLLIVDQMATDLEEALNERIFLKLRERGMTLIYFGHRVPAGLEPEQVYWMERGELRPYEAGDYEQSAPMW